MEGRKQVFERFLDDIPCNKQSELVWWTTEAACRCQQVQWSIQQAERGGTCTPYKSSQGWRFMRAHSELWPCSRLVHNAISPHVTSAPSCLQTRLHICRMSV